MRFKPTNDFKSARATVRLKRATDHTKKAAVKCNDGFFLLLKALKKRMRRVVLRNELCDPFYTRFRKEIKLSDVK